MMPALPPCPTDEDPTFADLLAWAGASNEQEDAIREVLKVPARLGLCDEDLGLIPATLGYFEEQIAGSSYGTVSKARDLKSARNRGNSRIRTLLKRYHENRDEACIKDVRAEWTRLVDFVARREGFLDRGAMFATGKSRGLAMLRARAQVAPKDMSASEINRIADTLTSEKRKAFSRALKTFNHLITDHTETREISDLLPRSLLPLPAPILGQRIAWESLPGIFRSDAERVMRKALAQPNDKVEATRARIVAGEDALTVLRELDRAATKRKRPPANVHAATANWRQAIVWLVRAAEAQGQRRETLTSIADLYEHDLLDQACLDQISRSRASLRRKNPEKSQTLAHRLTALETLARHGLQREELEAIVRLMRVYHHDYIRRPGKGMTDDAKRVCKALLESAPLVPKLVRAPQIISDEADKQISDACSTGHVDRELSALRLYATAVLFAVQMSRPVRTANLIRLRYRGTREIPGHITWIRKREHAELRYSPGEVKNDREIAVHLKGDDAQILWRWLYDLRPRYLELRGISDTPYVIPGTAQPRLQAPDLRLPIGCVAPSTFADIWRDGTAIIGLDLTPHQSRHAVATLILAMEPGNYAKAASVLGDTVATVERHYGYDDGAAASAEVRKVLLVAHPEGLDKIRSRNHA
ncbi:site-specific integrase [Yangia mangrovi]|uniref:Site-specific integrase n=2 Tax=Alloyangia mangrovi TaxID=1779329 RepID=A0ABT2KTE2_9RHOB|nr:site-specific integrase [Alloyangia mangrovi]MCT4373435.1 site-specific integrase [Alloyangia mangrovi]